MSFRNSIGTNALIHVKTFLSKFKKPEPIAEYVKSGIIYYGEIPFIYREFEPLDVRSSKEKGGYKVVSEFLLFKAKNMKLISCQTRHGPFQNQAILDTMLIYYGKRGIKEYLPKTSSLGKNPVGVLALICAAVRIPSPSPYPLILIHVFTG